MRAFSLGLSESVSIFGHDEFPRKRHAVCLNGRDATSAVLQRRARAMLRTTRAATLSLRSALLPFELSLTD